MVIGIDTDRLAICDLLLVIYSNMGLSRTISKISGIFHWKLQISHHLCL